MLTRYELTDAQWKAIKFLLPGRKDSPGVTARDNRKFVNAVLWILRTGASWRSLPRRYGSWKNVHRRFTRWQASRVWEKIFLHLINRSQSKYLSIDSTIVRCHQHGAGAQGTQKKDEAIGLSRGGFSTKIHVAVDSVGRPVRLMLSPGEAHDITRAAELIKGLKSQFVIGDKAYDQEKLIEQIESQGAEAVIPPRANRNVERYYDKEVYKERNQVERMFCRLKNFRRVATRYEKRAQNFQSMVLLAASMLWLSDS